MRVSVLALLSLVGAAMCQPQGVRFRDSMLGHMVSDTVSGGRGAVSDVMDMFSTIGRGMVKMVSPNGSRRKNRVRQNQPQFRQGGNNNSGLRSSGDNALRPEVKVDYDEYDYDDYHFEPQTQRPKKLRSPKLRRRRPLRQRQQQQFEKESVQRLSGDEINDFANLGTNNSFKKRKPHFSLQNPSSWFK